MMLSSVFALLIAASSASRLGAADGPAPASPLDGVKGFVDLLPYSPDRMNYAMTKSKCIDFLNQQLDRAGHDATLIPKLMPKCLWSKDECAALESDLLNRIPSTAMPGAPAAAPAPASPAALLATKVTKKSPGGGDAIFGWCDTLYNMAKTRFFSKLKGKKPAPGMEPLPEDTGNVHRDAKIMNKWMEKNIGGAPQPPLSKADKIIHKMKTVGNALKKATGWDHFKPERETAKKMAKGISGYDHAKGQLKKDDKKDDKKDKKEDKEEEKEDKEEEKEDEEEE